MSNTGDVIDLESCEIVGHQYDVCTAAFSPDGKYIASGGLAPSICLWDIETRPAGWNPFRGHTSGVSTVAFSPDGRYIVSGSFDGTLRLWDTMTGRAIASPFEGHTKHVESVAFSPDGQHIASGSSDNTVLLWDIKTGKAVFEPLRHPDFVTSVAFSSDGKHIISGSMNCTICLWDTTTGQNVSTRYANHSDPTGGQLLGFSPDGKLIASASSDGSMNLCNINTTENVMKSFQGHTDMVTSVAFSSDGKYIVSGSLDFTIRLWNIATGRTISGPCWGHVGYVRSVGFSPDEKYIVSTSADRTVRLWGTPSSFASRDTPFSKWSPLCLDGKVSNRSLFPVTGGGFSDVWKGSFGGDIVAIKIIRPFREPGSQIETSKLFKQLWREYRAWSNLSHPNVLDCLGFSYDFTPQSNHQVPSLISRWMANGDVLFYLKKYPDADRLKIVIGISKGLAYLHEKDPPIVHGDLRSGNILVSDDGNPCLTDFGLSRVISQTRGYTTSADVAGSLRWMAPELFRRAKVTSQSDVWAYGMTMLEIFTGSRPFKDVHLDPVVLHEILAGQIPERPAPADAPSFTDAVWTICQNCWNMDPTERLSVSEVYEELTWEHGNA